MSESVGEKIISAANEALSVAKGEQTAASVWINGHKYVPEAAVEDARVSALEEATRAVVYRLMYSGYLGLAGDCSRDILALMSRGKAS